MAQEKMAEEKISLEQVRHGVAIRMAVVERALTAGGKEGRA